ncbi:alpha/beta fold hydrolase [Bradyrhizobium erythrophlei]|uniref:Pimeloyl-ACP methyl ester carboxylesterase n=1 Tax=Bradyrhizobium erythrophlei TaxID=1437360 RepID=A0A1H4X0B7_9BRAD|nr:alpha/beta hydrolase [Bradyrhizobium erythrophlei]SEC98993.1 Pimeloyl-ACP methyl ester carboxylesterase [Bradyrhizobium erythrophlei]
MKRRDLLKATGLAVAGATTIVAPLIAQPIAGPSQVGHPEIGASKAENGARAVYKHETAPTQFVEANGIRFAYRRFGQESGTPILLMQHFRGGMDHWDPLVTNGLAETRPVILFDNAGVAASSGETPVRIDAMAQHAADFVRALGVQRFDLLGFSIGGYIAQSFSLQYGDLVRRLILVGTGPRAGQPPTDPKYAKYGGTTDPKTGEAPLEAFQNLFFSPSNASQAACSAFWTRRHTRTEDVDPPSSPQTAAAQRAAIAEWRQQRGERFAELTLIRQPTLVVNGNQDIMVPTVNSFTLSQHIPDAQLIIYPDSGHGSLFQFPELFVKHCRLFLDGTGGST